MGVGKSRRERERGEEKEIVGKAGARHITQDSIGNTLKGIRSKWGQKLLHLGWPRRDLTIVGNSFPTQNK